LAAILVTFPDPFPGKKECRLIQEGTVRDMRRCLRPTGRLYLATDHGGFFEWSKSILDRCSSEYVAVEPCPDRREWLPVVSKYEQKGWDEGRSTITACWEAV
jgi:tRNA (guanine-N7-)-methyltransferase